MSPIRPLKHLVFATAAILSASPTLALKINLNDIGGVTGSLSEIGFKVAAKYWESVFTNDAVVNLDVGFSSLGQNILGGTSTTLFTYVPISDYQFLLSQTGTSSLDSVVTTNLPPLSPAGSVAVTVPGYIDTMAQTGIDPLTSRLAPDGQPISNTMALASANIKALVGGFEDLTDAEIQFSSDFAFDFNPADGITPGSYDFIGVAVHEIGHALGFISGTDDFDFFAGDPGEVDSAWWAYGLDLFRYSADPQGTGVPGLDLTPGTASYFSIDGGATVFDDGYFSTGTDYGDGWQASHWKEPTTPCVGLRGIMNPYICDGLTDSVKSLDIAAFDAIGWNTDIDALTNRGYEVSTAEMYTTLASKIPEPSTWAMMAIGFGAVGAGLRGRRRTVRVSAAFHG